MARTSTLRFRWGQAAVWLVVVSLQQGPHPAQPGRVLAAEEVAVGGAGPATMALSWLLARVGQEAGWAVPGPALTHGHVTRLSPPENLEVWLSLS